MKTIIGLLAVVIVAVLGGCGGSSSLEFGSLSGCVIGDHNVPLSNVEIEISKTSPVLTVHADKHGKFTFANLPVGAYELVVRVQGYTERDESVTIIRGNTQLPPIMLKN